MDPLYPKIVEENFLDYSLIPFGQNIIYAAMEVFGGYDMTLALALAILGAMLGGAFNYGIGAVLAKLRSMQKEFFSDAHYNSLRSYFLKFGPLFVLFHFIPLGAIFVVVAGFFRLPILWTIPLLLAGQLLERFWWVGLW